MTNRKSCFLVILAIFLLLAPTVNYGLVQGAGAHPTLWAELYGSTGGVSSSVKELIQTSDGGYAFVVINATRNYAYFHTASPSCDLFKTNSTGQVEWQRAFNTDEVYGLFETADDGYMLETSSLIKLDSNGNVQWSHAFQTYGYMESVTHTSDDGYVLAGSAEQNLWFVKTDAEGNLQWNRTCQMPWSGGLAKLIPTSDGDYIAAGTVYPKNLTQQYAYSGSMVLSKIDLSGKVFWNVNFTGQYGVSPVLIQTSDGGYILADSFGSGGTPIVTKIDQNGSVQWAKEFDTAVTSIIELGNGHFVFGGEQGRTENWGPLVCLIETDSSGNVQWSQTYGSQSDGYFTPNVIETRNGDLVVGGYWGGWDIGYPSYWYLMEVQASLPTPLASPSLLPPPPSPNVTNSPVFPIDIPANTIVVIGAVSIIIAVLLAAFALFFRRHFKSRIEKAGKLLLFRLLFAEA